jgi:hypothetical protein
MKCNAFESIVLKLTRDEQIDASMRDEGLVHSKNCRRCSARLAEEEALLTSIRVAGEHLAKEEGSLRVEVAVLSAYRQYITQPDVQGSAPVNSSGQHRVRWWHVAAAAGVLIGIALTLVLQVRPQAHNNNEQSMPSAIGESETAGTIGNGGHKEIVVQDGGITNNSQPRRKRRTDGVQHLSFVETEVTTEFFPLVSGSDLKALDSGQVVRIELSGSALAAVGLPLEGEPSNEAVKADVVLGDDGLAKAIRFVR